MMEYVSLILIGVIIALLNTAAAESTDIMDVCGDEITMPYIKSTKLRYEGDMLERNSDCQIKFTLSDPNNYKICVRPLTLNLNCGTRILYQKYFVFSSTNDGELECGMNFYSSYEDECFPYVSTFFIIFERDDSYDPTSESAYIYVYAKEQQSYSSEVSEITSSSTWMVAVFGIIPIAFVVVCVIYCKIRQRRQQQYANTQVAFNTTEGSTTVPTGGRPNQQAYPQPVNQGLGTSGNPAQQPLAGYYVHPPVTSNPAQNPAATNQYPAQNPAALGQYPAQNPAALGPYNYQPGPQSYGGGMQPTPSAPPTNSFEEPPPSYESLMNK